MEQKCIFIFKIYYNHHRLIQRGWIRNGAEFVITGSEASSESNQKQPKQEVITTMALANGIERVIQVNDRNISIELIRRQLEFNNKLETIISLIKNDLANYLFSYGRHFENLHMHYFNKII